MSEQMIPAAPQARFFALQAVDCIRRQPLVQTSTGILKQINIFSTPKTVCVCACVDATDAEVFWKDMTSELDVLFCSICICVGFDPKRESSLMGKHCLFLWPKGDNSGACEESAVGHQMGSGHTVRGRR